MEPSYIFRKANELDLMQISSLLTQNYSSISNDTSSLSKALEHTLDMDSFFVIESDGVILAATKLTKIGGNNSFLSYSDALRYLGLKDGIKFYRVMRNPLVLKSAFSGGIISNVCTHPSFDSFSALEVLVRNIIKENEYNEYLVYLEDNMEPLMLDVFMYLGFSEGNSFIKNKANNYLYYKRA